MVQIDDGTGTGRKTEVDADFHLHTRAVDESLEHYVNETKQEAYHIVFTCSGVLPGAPFVYIKNSDDNLNLVIEGVKLHTECSPVIDHVANPTVGTITGTAITPSIVHIGAGNVADGDFYMCQSGCVSGVTGGTIIDRTFICSGCSETNYNYEMDVILPENQKWALFMKSTTCSGCNIAGTIPMYYSRKDIHIE